MHGKSILDYPGIPVPFSGTPLNVDNVLIQQELSYNRDAMCKQSLTLCGKFNVEQKFAFERIISSLDSSNASFFFVNGYGGTGKTFLWNALSTTLRARGEIVLNVASSGIAATLLPSGKTAHSRFAIPLQIHDSSMCAISQRSDLAELIQATTLIIWDEAPMI